MECPKCGHVRRPGATNPKWQCPACGVAYHKYRAYLASATERAKASVTPRNALTGPASLSGDGSVWALVIANIFTLAVAWINDWRLVDSMIVYWIQSVIIGLFSAFRILALDKFSTENFTMNNRPVESVPATKIKVALFFLFHFGFFHLVYLIFLMGGDYGELHFGPDLIVCALAFGINHLFSWRYHRDLDRTGTPNIGSLMFTPYLRVVPMHLTIIFGGVTTVSVLFFGIAKTIADVAMHQVEHKRLEKKLVHSHPAP